MIRAAQIGHSESGMSPRAHVAGVDPQGDGEARLPASDRLRAAFDMHFDFVWRSLLRLGAPPAAVDDLAQEVFVVLSRRIEEISIGREKAFLFGTAARVAAEERRARRRRVAGDSDGVDALIDPGPGPEATLDQRRKLDLLGEVLEAMDDDLRAVFVLYELEEMTMGEIATFLDIPPGTVASRLRRARESFATRIKRLQRRMR